MYQFVRQWQKRHRQAGRNALLLGMIVALSFSFLTGIGSPRAAIAAPSSVALPGTIELEDYTSFFDTTRGNSGRVYRFDDVDIQRCRDMASSGTCYNVTNVRPGEWLGFDVTVANGGTFTFSTRVASRTGGRGFHLEVDGVNVTGTVIIPNTGSTQRWVTVATQPIAISAGAHSLKLVAEGSNVNLNNVTVSQVTVDAPPPPPAPSTPTPEPQPQIPAVVSLPGTLEFENYADFTDTTPGNQGKKYRNDDVDIEDCTDQTSGDACYNVAWIKGGEWLGYNTTVAATGSYTFTTRVATPHDGRTFHFEVDGVDVTGPIGVPNTGAYQTWTSVTSIPVTLPAGNHVLRVVAGDSSFNLNNVTVAPVAAVAPAPAPEPTPEPTPAPQPEPIVAPAPAPAPAPQPSVTGPTYYVSTTGNDSADGSIGNPWRTLSASMKKLKAGDLLLVRGGEYRERVEVRGESVPRGTVDARITVRAFPGEEPLVVGIFWISNADYWTFDNIDVTWDSANLNSEEHMVRMYKGHGWIYQNSEIYGARSYAGLLVNGNSTGWLVTGNYIHDTAPSNDLSQDQLIYVSDGSSGVIERNLLTNAPNGRGVKLGNPQSGELLPANVIVRYNTIVNTGSGNVGVSYDAHDNQIYGNIMVNPGDNYYTVHAWYVTGANNVVRDNVAFGSKGVTKAGAGLVDGGNHFIDPMLDANYKPTNPALYDSNSVLQFGHLAGTTR